MLRRFARDYPTRVGRSARAVAEQIGVSRGAYNHFVHGKTRTQDRVRRPIAELYLSVPPELRGEPEEVPEPRRQRRVAERPRTPYADTLEKGLRRALPREAEAAKATIREMVEKGPGERSRAAARAAKAVEAVLLRWVEENREG